MVMEMPCNIFFDEKKVQENSGVLTRCFECDDKEKSGLRLVNGEERKSDISFLGNKFYKNHCFYLFTMNLTK